MPHTFRSYPCIFILEGCARATTRGGPRGGLTCQIWLYHGFCEGTVLCGRPGRGMAADGEDAYRGMYLTLGDFTKLLRYHIQNLARRQQTQVAEYLQSIDECHLVEFQAIHHDQLMRLAMAMPTSPALKGENVSLRLRVNMARAVFVSVLDQHTRMIRAGGRLAAQSA